MVLASGRTKPVPPEHFYYLATPYTNYPKGTEAAYRDACEIAGFLIGRGHLLFCPIAHSHPIAEISGLDTTDHDLWLGLDRPFLDACTALLVAEMDAWQESYGVQYEIDYFKERGKPIFNLFLPNMKVRYD